jgi:REP element-mobilizing transposase RayT
LPAGVIEELRHERDDEEKAVRVSTRKGQERVIQKEQRWRKFDRFDSLLDGCSKGPFWLREPAIAEIVKEAIHYRDGLQYDLLSYCIMPNHVHMVFDLGGRPDWPARPYDRGNFQAGGLTYTPAKILKKLKWYTALKANECLGRHGAFWQGESYDHVIREGDELERILWYVILNPEKAKLVKSWREWRWTYCKPGLLPL